MINALCLLRYKEIKAWFILNLYFPLMLLVVALLQNLPHEHTTAMRGLRDNETT